MGLNTSEYDVRKNKFVGDSCCTSHIANNATLFSSLEDKSKFLFTTM